MKVVNLKEAQLLTGQMRTYAYNAMDCIATRMIADNILPKIEASPQTLRTYGFERASQLPAFAMTNRGIRQNTVKRDEVTVELGREYRKKVKALNKEPKLLAVWDGMEKVTGTCPTPTRKDGKHKWEKGVPDGPDRKCVDCGTSRFKREAFNPASSLQRSHLFYDIWGLPKQLNKDHKVSTDHMALEALGRKFPLIRPITDAIIEGQRLHKQIGFLKARLTPSQRYPSVFNVGAAWTGRWSSNKNPYGEGGNSQNIAEQHRFVFEADPGKELCYMDLKQAESNTVAHLAGDEGYIEAHKEGDVHTYVTKMLWPSLSWTGNPKEDAKLAKSTLPEWDNVPGHDIRFQSKRIQHGGNYGLKPFGIALIAHIPVHAAKTMYHSYHGAFPEIRGWQDQTRAKVEGQEILENPLGVQVKLFGRPWDEHTYKQGLSYPPQSLVGHLVAIGAYRIYVELDPFELELLAQVHDALLFQFPKGRMDTVKKAIDLMTIPVLVKDYKGVSRTMQIEVEASTGLNWGKASETNPNGLKEVH